MYSTHSKRKRKRRPNTTSRSAGGAIKRRSKTAEGKVTRGRKNVFEDLGFGAPAAANLKIRADLMLDLRQYIAARGWTQAEAAAFFNETQPRISNLLKGEISRFSIDKLINLLARAGVRVHLSTESKAA